MTSYRQEKSENKKWLRNQKQQAYSNALRSLSRSTVIPVGLDIDEIEKWFYGLSEIRESLVNLQVYCLQNQNRIKEVSEDLFMSIDNNDFASVATEVEMMKEKCDSTGMVVYRIAKIRKRINDALEEITKTARFDLGKDITS
ncbi:MAG: hypothetical protein GY795_45035 [Desulfobacterales bacterium]|nr:hypothetical protein [Desulfobacterales bacterium]